MKLLLMLFYLVCDDRIDGQTGKDAMERIVFASRHK